MWGKELATEKKKKKRHFSHGRTRKNTEISRSKDTEAAKELATDEHGKTRNRQKKKQKNY
jgi:hypothetical protein